MSSWVNRLPLQDLDPIHRTGEAKVTTLQHLQAEPLLFNLLESRLETTLKL